jgi:hypothetical protein
MCRLFLSYFFLSLLSITASAESIPYEKLVGVWTVSQNGVNHNLTKAQVSELCGMVFSIIHPNLNMDNHIRFTQDGKLLMSMDVLSKEPCTYADNQLSCEMEYPAFGKSQGIQPGITHFQKVRDGVYDVTALKPDGKTVHQVQTMYPCSMTILEALTWLETHSGPGEVGEKMEEGLELLEKAAPKILEKAFESLPDLYQQIESGVKSNNKKIEFLKKNAEAGDGHALAGLGILKLMSIIMPTGVENDPQGGLSKLKEAAELQAVTAYVMLATVNMLAMAKLKQDFGTAARWLEKAELEQRADARNALGMFKLFGLGVEQDGEEAVKLLTLSAQQGDASAHFNLGIIHVF